jgi:hypothetical protein
MEAQRSTAQDPQNDMVRLRRRTRAVELVTTQISILNIQDLKHHFLSAVKTLL